MRTKQMGKRLLIWAIMIGGILMIPYIGQFPWTPGDYIFAGVVLTGLALIYDFVTKNMKSKMHRMAVALVLLFVIVLIIGWAATGPD